MSDASTPPPGDSPRSPSADEETPTSTTTVQPEGNSSPDRARFWRRVTRRLCRPLRSDNPGTPNQPSTERMTARGTWLAGLAATAGLVFSAVTTLYTGLAFNSQAQQQREDSDTESARQASRLNAYITPASGRMGEIAVIENTAGLPAYSVSIGIAVRTDSMSAKEQVSANNEVDFVVGTVLPCTKVSIDLRAAIALIRPSAFTHAPDAFTSTTRVQVNSGLVVQFYDAAGKLWWRDSGSDGLDATTDATPPGLQLVEDAWKWKSRGYLDLDLARPQFAPRWGRTRPLPAGNLEERPSPQRSVKATLCSAR